MIAEWGRGFNPKDWEEVILLEGDETLEEALGTCEAKRLEDPAFPPLFGLRVLNPENGPGSTKTWVELYYSKERTE